MIGEPHVNRCTVLILAAAIGGGCALAQTGNPLIAEAKQNYTSIKNNLTKAADKMSEADYSFKATPDVRTFGGSSGISPTCKCVCAPA